MRLLPIASALLIGCAAACSDARDDAASNSAPAAAAEPTEPAFAPELAVVLDSMTRTAEGLYLEDVRAGSGRAAELGRVVIVEYRAWLPDGALFEQRPSADGFGPSEFVLGENAPVPGLNAGIAGMRAGGVRRIVVPPALGYGLVGRPAAVPAGSALLFEVKLLSVHD